MATPRRSGSVLAAFAFAVAAALGCGSSEGELPRVEAPPPAAEEATTRLADARGEVEALRASLAERSQARETAETQAASADEAVERAREEENEARDALRSAEERLRELQPKLSDAELFRRVQRTLLDAPALAQVAIAAQVEKGAVTLRGRVPDEATRDAALATARSVDGVREVESEIEVAR